MRYNYGMVIYETENLNMNYQLIQILFRYILKAW